MQKHNTVFNWIDICCSEYKIYRTNIAKQKKIEEIHYKKWFPVENLS